MHKHTYPKQAHSQEDRAVGCKFGMCMGDGEAYIYNISFNHRMSVSFFFNIPYVFDALKLLQWFERLFSSRLSMIICQIYCDVSP